MDDQSLNDGYTAIPKSTMIATGINDEGEIEPLEPIEYGDMNEEEARESGYLEDVPQLSFFGQLDKRALWMGALVSLCVFICATVWRSAERRAEMA